ncbi:MAG TPA: aromatic acid exporter family protein [Bacilli bacterium]|nr:aromatic acid exporter family protein [Bacilli bacterium]
MKIGYRTLKTAVGTGLSISLASYLGLEFYSFAGILTILSLRETVKRSFRDAKERFIACLVGMAFASVAFSLIGFHPWTIALLLVFMIPTLVKFKAQGSITTACVIILHMYILHHVNFATVRNEVVLIAVGVGIALLLNSYMPSMEKELIRYQTQIESNFRLIFQELAAYLRDGKSDWGGEELIETSRLLDEAIARAQRDVENQILRTEHGYLAYFLMRNKQFELLEDVMTTLSSLSSSYVQGRQIADFLENMTEAIALGNLPSTEARLAELQGLRAEIKKSALPQDRQEFENRAAMHHFLNDMERYLELKRQFFQR